MRFPSGEYRQSWSSRVDSINLLTGWDLSAKSMRQMSASTPPRPKARWPRREMAGAVRIEIHAELLSGFDLIDKLPPAAAEIENGIAR